MHPGPYRNVWLLALVTLLVAGLCVGVGVQADRNPTTPTATVIPYDPLQRW
jgi:hypothetical protein